MQKKPSFLEKLGFSWVDRPLGRNCLLEPPAGLYVWADSALREGSPPEEEPHVMPERSPGLREAPASG
ncbi:hypothetical protein HYR99_00925 [Candidatus Poribacteria bacterium]|nr:hypothetical protein [Candidatus Poribacteria bacterium]